MCSHRYPWWHSTITPFALVTFASPHNSANAATQQNLMRRRQVVVLIVLVLFFGFCLGYIYEKNSHGQMSALGAATMVMGRGNTDPLKKSTATIFQALYEASFCIKGNEATKKSLKGRREASLGWLPDGMVVPYEIRLNSRGRAIHALRDMKKGLCEHHALSVISRSLLFSCRRNGLVSWQDTSLLHSRRVRSIY